ncbi:hypothetical protein UPYG_G00274170 [Umbra pygmaea]|uniref:Uncharacterized protein n=1 Tax=Umbra pygmaea TaxID=75934 RepID=A0ABD0WKW7_UMBPY
MGLSYTNYVRLCVCPTEYNGCTILNYFRPPAIGLLRPSHGGRAEQRSEVQLVEESQKEIDKKTWPEGKF